MKDKNMWVQDQTEMPKFTCQTSTDGKSYKYIITK